MRRLAGKLFVFLLLAAGAGIQILLKYYEAQL